MTTQLPFAAVNGIVLGMAVFLVAAGLTLVFGILRIFNFAHGSFFMIGAYLTHAMIGQEPSSLLIYVGASVVAGLVIGLVGLCIDRGGLGRPPGVSHDYLRIAPFPLPLAGG